MSKIAKSNFTKHFILFARGKKMKFQFPVFCMCSTHSLHERFRIPESQKHPNCQFMPDFENLLGMNTFRLLVPNSYPWESFLLVRPCRGSIPAPGSPDPQIPVNSESLSRHPCILDPPWAARSRIRFRTFYTRKFSFPTH
jgi:hypothetical protein